MQLIVYVSVLLLLSFTVFGFAFAGRRMSALPAFVAILFARVVPHLGPSTQWYHDSYFYFLATEALLESGRLASTPEIAAIWTSAGQKLYYFVLPVLTASLATVTGVDSTAPLRLYVPVLFGPVVFIAVWAIYSQFLSSEWAIIGAFTYTMLDSVMAHHLIYHQQAIGVVLLLFVLLPVMMRISSRRLRVPLLLFVLVLPFTHNLTPYFAGFLLVGLAGGAIVIGRWFDPWMDESIRHLRDLSRVALVYGAVLLALTTFVSVWILKYFAGAGVLSGGRLISASTFTSPVPHYKTGGSASIIDQAPLVTKLLLGVLSLPAIAYGLRDRRHRLQLPILAAGLTGAGIAIGVVLVNIAVVGRGVTFGYVFAVLLAVLTVAKASRGRLQRPVRVAATVVFTVLIVANTLVAVTPSMIDSQADITDDGYHQIEPIGRQSPAAGSWIRSYAPSESTIWAVHRHRAVVFYYGRHPVEYLSVADSQGYALNDERRFPGLTERGDRYYSNGRLTIGYGSGQEINPGFYDSN